MAILKTFKMMNIINLLTKFFFKILMSKLIILFFFKLELFFVTRLS